MSWTTDDLRRVAESCTTAWIWWSFDQQSWLSSDALLGSFAPLFELIVAGFLTRGLFRTFRPPQLLAFWKIQNPEQSGGFIDWDGDDRQITKLDSTGATQFRVTMRYLEPSALGRWVGGRCREAGWALELRAAPFSGFSWRTEHSRGASHSRIDDGSQGTLLAPARPPEHMDEWTMQFSISPGDSVEELGELEVTVTSLIRGNRGRIWRIIRVPRAVRFRFVER